MPTDPANEIRAEESTDHGAPRCSACGAERMRRFGAKNGYALQECVSCGTIFTKARTIENEHEGNELKELYDHYYDAARFEIHPVAAQTYDRLVQSCERFRSTGRWVDIGYGEGGLLQTAAAHGWACYGTEISPRALQYGERQGWIVTADADGSPDFPRGGFDVVTMLECIEHFVEPHQFLSLAARLLRPGGLLHLTTPNARSINRRLLGINWSIFHPPEHLTIWSGRGLHRALLAHGFERPVVRAVGFNPFDLKSAAFRSRSGESGSGRTGMALELNQAFSRSRFRRGVKHAINWGLSLSGVGDGLKVWGLRSSMDVEDQTNHAG